MREEEGARRPRVGAKEEHLRQIEAKARLSSRAVHTIRHDQPEKEHGGGEDDLPHSGRALKLLIAQLGHSIGIEGVVDCEEKQEDHADPRLPGLQRVLHAAAGQCVGNGQNDRYGAEEEAHEDLRLGEARGHVGEPELHVGELFTFFQTLACVHIDFVMLEAREGLQELEPVLALVIVVASRVRHGSEQRLAALGLVPIPRLDNSTQGDLLVVCLLPRLRHVGREHEIVGQRTLGGHVDSHPSSLDLGLHVGERHRIL
mmetsp:Transcript_16603/g.44737  ORF Transcript_16603/g.44737 Transcript_16603/m.44737 type:complete len:258 (+) Transcript_16603:875-1648(+)